MLRFNDWKSQHKVLFAIIILIAIIVLVASVKYFVGPVFIPLSPRLISNTNLSNNTNSSANPMTSIVSEVASGNYLLLSRIFTNFVINSCGHNQSKYFGNFSFINCNLPEGYILNCYINEKQAPKNISASCNLNGTQNWKVYIYAFNNTKLVKK